MNLIKFNFLLLIKISFVFLCVGYILICPFTKVEESFNLQAIHDILFYQSDISKYDHNQFPGVVPRTFIGALIVAISSSPLIKLIGLFSDNIFLNQLVVRFVLGLYVLSGFFHFSLAIRKVFNSNVEKWTLILTLTQFHFVFYMSRTLPNIFALVCFLHATAFWLKGKQLLFVWFSAGAILIFRFELCIICGLMLLISLANRKLSILNLILNGALALILFVGTSILIDSYFWGYWLYPEGQVLWFNTILNKSSEWGTSPFLWYFYSAIPRALLFSIFFIPFAFFYDTKKVLNLFIPSIGFVFIYSFLPHKELRFIIYTFPMLNAIAAQGIVNIRKHRLVGGILKKIILLSIYCHLIANLLITSGFLNVSRSNYPGGEALIKLHEIEANSNANVNVHIDVLSAQTGISRFLEMKRNLGWIYDKNEYIYSNSTEILNYTHLLAEGESDKDPRISIFSSTHHILDVIYSYSGINYPKSIRNIFFPTIKYTPKIFILKRISNV